MKPKEYLKEFNLSADKFEDKQFTFKLRGQIYEDFIDLITNVRMSPIMFKNITKQIMDKVNIIMTMANLTDESKRKKFSGFIYASVVIKERNKLYPDWSKACLEHKLKTDKDFERRYENYQWRKREDAYWENFYAENFRSAFKNAEERLREMYGNPIQKEFEEKAIQIGFSTDEIVNEESINRYFRIQSKKYHPDSQSSLANAAIFNEVVECKDWLISHLQDMPSEYTLKIENQPGGYKFEYIDKIF